MPRRKQRSRAEPVGQLDVFGKIHGLDKLVTPPDVIESEGLKVIHFAISEKDKATPGYVDEVRSQARKLLPETKSVGKPPWLKAEWQAKRRKNAANNN
jgi:hypothetical protein